MDKRMAIAWKLGLCSAVLGLGFTLRDQGRPYEVMRVGFGVRDRGA